ncbi:MAG: hypothetical protein ACXU9U_02985 [Parachlamydiaceae bacterium]
MGDEVFVKFSPAREPFIPGEDKNKPTGAPNTVRNFKKVLEDKPDEKDDGVRSAQTSKKSKPVQEEDEGSHSTVTADEEAETGEKVFSLFSQRKSKVSLSKQFSQDSQAEEGESEATARTAKPVAFNVDGEPAPIRLEKQVQPERKELPIRVVAETKAAEDVATAAPVQVPVKKDLKSIYEQQTVRGNEGASKEKPSLFALSAKKPVSNMDINPDEKGDEASAVVVDELESKKGAVFVREQVDISTVNPQSNPVTSVSATADVGAKAPMAPSATVAELINQLLKELTTMSVGDKTETTIVLKHPPLLDGAQVVMTGFDSARGELNIKFANLTQQAQALIEQQQQSLLTALETKGYHVHIFVATTVNEPQIMTTAGQPTDKERQQRQEQGQGQGRPKEEREG